MKYFTSHLARRLFPYSVFVICSNWQIHENSTTFCNTIFCSFYLRVLFLIQSKQLEIHVLFELIISGWFYICFCLFASIAMGDDDYYFVCCSFVVVNERWFCTLYGNCCFCMTNTNTHYHFIRRHTFNLRLIKFNRRIWKLFRRG